MYDERKEAYIGLVEAWMKQEQEGTSEANSLTVGHWLLRCQFVAPEEMLPALLEWERTEPGSTSRMEATKNLKEAMRRDLSNFQ
jgi:hypothetical protein